MEAPVGKCSDNDIDGSLPSESTARGFGPQWQHPPRSAKVLIGGEARFDICRSGISFTSHTVPARTCGFVLYDARLTTEAYKVKCTRFASFWYAETGSRVIRDSLFFLSLSPQRSLQE